MHIEWNADSIRGESNLANYLFFYFLFCVENCYTHIECRLQRRDSYHYICDHFTIFNLNTLTQMRPICSCCCCCHLYFLLELSHCFLAVLFGTRYFSEFDETEACFRIKCDAYSESFIMCTRMARTCTQTPTSTHLHLPQIQKDRWSYNRHNHVDNVSFAKEDIVLSCVALSRYWICWA